MIKKILLYNLLLFAIASCGSKKRVAYHKKQQQKVVVVDKKNTEVKVIHPKVNKTHQEYTLEYIHRYAPIAMEEMRKYKIPASITLAQGILESRSGRSELSEKSNNHFGIKCHKGWTGGKVYHDDDAKGECFRKYKNPITSFEDHSEFLTTRGRYSGLFNLKIDDYKAWARGLRAAGYATDRMYPQKLISLVEKHKLYKFDDRVLGKRIKEDENIPEIIKAEEVVLVTDSIKTTDNKAESVVIEVSTDENINTHTVIKGDTLYSISKKYELTVEILKQLNQLETNDLKIGQVIHLTNPDIEN